MRLEGKVTLISGAARGIGAAQARLFCREGAKIIIGDIREEEGRQLEQEIRKTGGSALFVKLDVTIEDDWENAAKAAASLYGPINVLVNNAGIGSPARWDNLSRNIWDQLMLVNATGVFLGTKIGISEMLKENGGSIINISSQLGIVGHPTVHPAYIASKGAIRSLTKAIAIQYASNNIRCNSVHPGPVETDMVPVNTLERYVPRIPLGRWGQPEDVAYAVAYLASEESSYVTGAELVVDGGWIAQ